MIYCDTNKNTHFIFDGEWNNRFDYYGLYVVTEHNNMYVVQNMNDKILTIESTLPKIFKFLKLDDVLLLSAPVEIINDYTSFNYGSDDDENYTQVSINQINIEIVDVVSKINDINIQLLSLLNNYLVNYDKSKYTDSNNHTLQLKIKNIIRYINETDLYNIYTLLLSIKSKIINDKMLTDFITDNLGDLDTKHTLGYQKLLLVKV